jgi:hypothetical protein
VKIWIKQVTSWCANKRCRGCRLYISSHRSTHDAGSSGICIPNYGPKTWVTAGGIGYFYVTKKTKAGFWCGTVQSWIARSWYHNAWGWTGVA